MLEAVYLLSSCVLFASIRILIWYFSLLPHIVAKSDRWDVIWRWYNVWVSWTHSLFAGATCLYCLYRDPDMLNNLNKNCDSAVSSFLVSASTGYFLYDAVDFLACVPISNAWDVLAHHVVVITCFVLVVKSGLFIPFAVVALLVEVNSIFLHARQLMRMAGLSHTVWYSLNMLTNIVTFIACRFISIAWMMRWFWHNAEDIDQPYYGVLATSLPVMYIINIILFFKIMSKDAKHILSIVKNFKSGIHNSWRKCQSHDHPPTCINSKMLRRD